MSTQTLGVGVHCISKSPRGDRAMVVVIEKDPVSGKKTSKTCHVAVRGGQYEKVVKVYASEGTKERVEQSWDVEAVVGGAK